MKNDISKYISHQMLHKWTRREKYVKYPNFPTPFCLSLTLVRNVLAKFQDPSNLHTPPVDKSNARFQLIKVHKQLASCQEIISPNETKKPMEQQDILTSMKMDQDFGSGFPRNSIILQHVFYIAVALKRKWPYFACKYP